jgi:hypothetical protein
VATKSDFTETEWKAMEKGVTGAGMLVSVSDRDFTDSFGEASALAKALAAHRDQSSSDLVREIASVRGTGFRQTLPAGGRVGDARFAERRHRDPRKAPESGGVSAARPGRRRDRRRGEGRGHAGRDGGARQDQRGARSLTD